MIGRFTSFLAVVGLAAITTGAAQAATCNAKAQAAFSPTAECATGSTNNDQINPNVRVNLDSMFGRTDWSFIAKDNDLNGTDAGQTNALTITGGLKSGLFEVASSIWSKYNKVMLVMKGGNDANNSNRNYVAHLLSQKTGSYQTAFYQTTGQKNPKDISHITLYAADIAAVSLPAGGLLLIGALGGLAALRRRKTA